MTAPDGEVVGYRGRPVVKTPAWTWQVPWYLYAGGIAGASSVIGAAARATGNHALARGAVLAAGPAAAVSPVLLVADLGVPRRFLNMLRVFRVSSPMSMGSWLLAGYAPLAMAATGAEVLGIVPRLARLAEAGAGVLGPGLATYTGVLVADTVVPVWHEAHRDLPFVFAGSAAASAGAAALLLTPGPAAEPARRVALAGAVAELAATSAMERRLGPLAAPYHGEGPAGRLLRWSKRLTVAGTTLLTFRNRLATTAGAALLLAGGACLRWSVFKAGFASAADPTATIRPQRSRIQART
jgi:formate-dependent nitrite reductase membrane component NrfD